MAAGTPAADRQAIQPETPPDSFPFEAEARDSTELAEIRGNYTIASIRHSDASAAGSERLTKGLRHQISTFWKRQISVTVDHVCCRDHLAVERTFLSYLRTSLALSMIGVTVAQLFRLNHAPTPSKIFGFYVLGRPLACICQGAAIYVLLLGAFRTWRSQNAIVRGKALSGGFEMVFLGAGLAVIILMFFVLLIAVDISKED